jgi:hypothetical protein
MTFKAVFPDILARDPSGQGRPGASGAVSGCNILILPVDASAADSGIRHRLRPISARFPQKHGIGILGIDGVVR